MTGQIIKVQVNKVKGEPPIEVESCIAQEGTGIIGDRHVGMGERDVCICRKEILDWMQAQEIQGLCFARHKENLLIEGFESGVLVPGKYLEGKEVVLEISDFPKHCFPPKCPLAQARKKCHLKDEYQMARIIRSGTIHKNEEVVLKELV